MLSAWLVYTALVHVELGESAKVCAAGTKPTLAGDQDAFTVSWIKQSLYLRSQKSVKVLGCRNKALQDPEDDESSQRKTKSAAKTRVGVARRHCVLYIVYLVRYSG